MRKQTMRVPKRSHLSPVGGGVTRAAVHRLAADGYDSKADYARSPDVATCRQTVEALLAPLSTAWQRMATIQKQTMRVPRRSHLSPDGGGTTRVAVHRLAADGYDSKADDARSPDVATCRQTVGALLAPLPPLGSGWLRCESRRCASPDVATCRQSVEALLAPLSTAWQRMATIRKQTMRVPRT
jgi:hypothetical protein